MCSQATLDTTVRQLKTIIDPQKPATDYKNANFPVDQEGRTLHLGCKASTCRRKDTVHLAAGASGLKAH
jgi:hypothetical protein